MNRDDRRRLERLEQQRKRVGEWRIEGGEEDPMTVHEWEKRYCEK